MSFQRWWLEVQLGFWRVRHRRYCATLDIRPRTDAQVDRLTRRLNRYVWRIRRLQHRLDPDTYPQVPDDF
jgi:hypothetical protein